MSRPVKNKSKASVFASRLLSTLVLWAVVIGVFVSGNPWAFVGLVLFLAFGGMGEFLVMMRRVPGHGSRVLASSVGGGLLLALAAYVASPGGTSRPDFLWEFGGLVLALVAGACWRFRHAAVGRDSLDAISTALLVYVYVPILFGSFVLRILFFPEGSESAVPGAWLLLLMIAAAKFTDMGAYVTGSLIGKHKMAPKISPAKTWEGFFGAHLFAQAGAWLVWYLAGESLAWLPAHHLVILTILIALVSVAGDLVESIIKRSLEVKDSGCWLPGIGGVLDLIDSLCFAAPVLYFYLVIFQLG